MPYPILNKLEFDEPVKTKQLEFIAPMGITFVWECTVKDRLFGGEPVKLMGETYYGGTLAVALEKLVYELEDKAKSIYKHFEIDNFSMCRKELE